MSKKNMDGGNDAGVDQEQDNEAPAQEGFKPLIDLPKGWDKELYEELVDFHFSNFDFNEGSDEIDSFINSQREKQQQNPNLEVVDREKIYEMKRALLTEFGKKYEKVISRIEQLQEEQKKLERSPVRQRAGVIDKDMERKKKEHGKRVSEFKIEQNKVLPRLKEEKQALEEKLASFPELVKPSFFASKGVKENYTGRKYDKEKLITQISELETKIESAGKDAGAYQKQIDDSAEVLKKELIPLEQEHAQVITSEQYKQDSAKLREVKSELEGLNKILNDESDELIDAYNVSVLGGGEPEERPEWLERATGSRKETKIDKIKDILGYLKLGKKE